MLRNQYMHRVKSFLFPFLLFCNSAVAQFSIDEKAWLERLDLNGGLPEKLLSTRSVVFYDYTLTEKELVDVQQTFQRTGIDAVAYFELDMLMAGRDVTKTFGDYFVKREIINLLFVEKDEQGFRITVTFFNGKESVIDEKQNAWSKTNNNLSEALKGVCCVGSIKKEAKIDCSEGM